MSLQNLLEGDCGGQNPVVKIGSHFTQDPGFRQEKAHAVPPDYNQADVLVNEFLEENVGANVQTFHMDEIYRELRDIDPPGASSAANVTQPASGEMGSMWSQQFLNEAGEDQLMPQAHQEDQASLPVAIDGEASKDKLRPVQGSLKDLGDTWSVDFQKMKQLDESQFGLGKEWVENFLKNGENKTQADSASTNEKNEEAGSSKFIKFMQTGKNQEGQDEKPDWSDEFAAAELDPSEIVRLNKAWNEKQEIDKASRDESSSEFWKKMEREWEKLSEQDDDDSSSSSWEKEYYEEIESVKGYKFEKYNPMKEIENPFEEGLRKLEENDLPSAVLCFEAAALADLNNPTVWQYLGTTQAENEQDPQAIAALKRAINLQSDNLVALMSLAISYTNEGCQHQACQTLKQWIRYNPKYADLIDQKVTGISKNFGPSNKKPSYISPIFTEVRDLYISAANKFPHGEIDPDVQCGLGVLFNLSDDFDNAVDCFKAALQARPKDSRMWNRLGATLANGNRSEEAVDAYYNSLHLSPGFIRARYNIGITCINLGANKEAAEHLLTALNQQSKAHTAFGRLGTMSESIWTTLKFAINLMGRQDLGPAVDKRDLATLNQEFKVK